MLGAAFTSFVLPGFAQARAGARDRAIAFLALGVLTDAALVRTIWAIVAMLAVRLLSAADGAWCARKAPAGPAARADALIIATAVVGVVALLGIRIATSQERTPSSSMVPTLEVGDHFFVDHVSAVGRGDVIVFKMPCEPEREYAKRVVAVAGDTVELRCEVLYLNGKPVKRELLASHCTYDDFDDIGDRWFSRDCTRFRETLDGRSYDVLGAAPHAPPITEHDFPNRDEMPVPPSCGMAKHDDPNAALATDQHAGSIVDGPTRPVDPCMPSEHYVVPEDSLFVLGDNRANSNDSRYWGVVPTSMVLGRATGIWRSSGKHGMFSRFGDIR